MSVSLESLANERGIEVLDEDVPFEEGEEGDLDEIRDGWDDAEVLFEMGDENNEQHERIDDSLFRDEASDYRKIIHEQDPLYSHLFHHGLLSAGEEVSLALAVRKGREVETRVGEKTWLEREWVTQGKQAQDRLVMMNQKLVASIARKYLGRGMTYMDLMQEGSIGLLYAVERYDPDRGFRFSTYATWWVRQAIMRALAQKSRAIRLPVYLHEKSISLKRMMAQLRTTLLRDPTVAELAGALGWRESVILDILQADTQPLSLEYRVDEEHGEFGETLPDDAENVSVEQVAQEQVISEQVRQHLGDILPPRELLVMQLRFGVGRSEAMTLEQIGEKLGVTRERIRQIEAKATQKLQKDRRLRALLVG